MERVMFKRKAFDAEGSAIWVILGDRKGWNRNDWRRVWEDINNTQYIKINGAWIRLKSYARYRKFRMYAISADGETRECFT